MDIGQQKSGASKRTDSNIAKALHWARRALGLVQQFVGVFANHLTSTNTSGATVAAGANITPPISFPLTATTNGKVRILTAASFTSGAGTVTPVLFLAVDAGPAIAIFKWNQTSDAAGDIGGGFDLNSGVTGPGHTLHLSWTTTLGDAVATLGNGVSMVTAAALTVEELPG